MELDNSSLPNRWTYLSDDSGALVDPKLAPAALDPNEFGDRHLCARWVYNNGNDKVERFKCSDRVKFMCQLC